MKAKFILSSTVLVLGSLFLLSSCKDDKATVAPDGSLAFTSVTLTTNKGTDRASGAFTSNGDITVTDYGFVYGEESGLDIEEDIKVSMVRVGTTLPITTHHVSMRTILALKHSAGYYITTYAVRENGQVEYGKETFATTVAGNQWTYPDKVEYPGKVSYLINAALVGTDLYTAGGVQYVGDVPNKEVYQYSFTTNQYTKLADYPGPTAATRPFLAIGKKLYLISVTQTYEYDIDKNRWARKADFPGVGGDAGFCDGFAIGSKIYAGSAEVNANIAFYSFDPSDNTNGVDEFGDPKGKWTPVSDYIGKSHFRNFAFTYNGKGYIVNGGNSVILNEYDPVANEWNELTTYPGVIPSASGGNLDGCAFVIGDKIYVYPGLSNQNEVTSVWAYDLSEQSWEEVNGLDQESVLKTQSYNIAFSLGGQGYVYAESTMAKYIPE